MHQLTQLRRRPPALDDAEDRRPGSSQKLFAALIQSGSSVARTRKEARARAHYRYVGKRGGAPEALPAAADGDDANPSTRRERTRGPAAAQRQQRSASTGARAAALVRWTLVGSGPAERTHLQTAQEERSGNT